jgi:hypothetical protein
LALGDLEVHDLCGAGFCPTSLALEVLSIGLSTARFHHPAEPKGCKAAAPLLLCSNSASFAVPLQVVCPGCGVVRWLALGAGRFPREGRRRTMILFCILFQGFLCTLQDHVVIFILFEGPFVMCFTDGNESSLFGALHPSPLKKPQQLSYIFRDDNTLFIFLNFSPPKDTECNRKNSPRTSSNVATQFPCGYFNNSFFKYR